MSSLLSEKRVFNGRIYLGNTWYFYVLFGFLLVLGLLLNSGVLHLHLSASLPWSLNSQKLGRLISLFSGVALPWMLLANLNIGKWYTVDSEGIALIRFGFAFKKFYFKDLASLTKLSTEETKELLYREYAPTLRFRRPPRLAKLPGAWQLGVDVNNLTRYSTVAIVVTGIGTGYQYPTVSDAKKIFYFVTTGPFVRLTTKENKHILISPREVDQFIEYANHLWLK